MAARAPQMAGQPAVVNTMAPPAGTRGGNHMHVHTSMPVAAPGGQIIPPAAGGPPQAPGAGDPRYPKALETLRGGCVSYLGCYVALLVSVVITAVGIGVIPDSTPDKQVLATQTLLFLVGIYFLLAKVAQDYLTGVDSTWQYFAVAIVFFVVAWGYALYSIITISSEHEWRGFYVMAIMWVMVCSMNLTKTVSLRNEAVNFQNIPPEGQTEAVQLMCEIAMGNGVYLAYLWISAMVSVAFMLIWMWTWDSSLLDTTDKGFFSLALIFSMAMCVFFGKFLPAQPVKKSVMIQHQLLAMFFLAVAIVSLIAVVFGLQVGPRYRLFLLTGSGLIVTTTCFLAKHLKKRHDVQEILESTSGSAPKSGFLCC